MKRASDDVITYQGRVDNLEFLQNLLFRDDYYQKIGQQKFAEDNFLKLLDTQEILVKKISDKLYKIISKNF